MNASQRVSTWIFAAAIAASINYAPWERSLTMPDLGKCTCEESHSEIWEPPVIQRWAANGTSQNMGDVRLRTEVLIMEWIAASLIYGSVFFALADKPKQPSEPEQETAENERVN
jgi:hypothetical protein